MDFFTPREPVSTWSHGIWLLLAVPGTVLLWKRSRGDRARQVSLLIYGLSLIFCSAASTLYHAVRSGSDRIATFALLDYLGIYLLVAGSYTPIVWNVLRGRWRAGSLILVWLWAAAGSALRLTWTAQPHWLATALYLGMGWSSALCYVEVARRLSHRTLLPIPVGGLLYSLGAVVNLLERPVLWPGVFASHELFHLFVVAGSLVHYRFLLRVIVPYTEEPGSSEGYSESVARATPSPFGSTCATGDMGG